MMRIDKVKILLCLFSLVCTTSGLVIHYEQPENLYTSVHLQKMLNIARHFCLDEEFTSDDQKYTCFQVLEDFILLNYEDYVNFDLKLNRQASHVFY